MLTKGIAGVVGGVILLASVTACTAPSGGGEECEWELKNRSKSHSLTLVSSTRTYLPAVTRPRPAPGPKPAPRINTVKPRPGSKPAPGGVVKPGSRKPVKMPTVKPPKPTTKPPQGKVWVLDCD